MNQPLRTTIVLVFLINIAGPLVQIGVADDKPAPANREPIVQAANGTITLWAKQATMHGTTVRYEPQPHKNTIGYWTKTEDWVGWEFKLRKPGTFAVELTQACGKGSGGSEYTVSIGDQTLTDVVPDTGAFTNFVNRVIGTVALTKPGEINVRVKPVKKPGLAVMDLRAVTLKPARAMDPRKVTLEPTK